MQECLIVVAFINGKLEGSSAFQASDKMIILIRPPNLRKRRVQSSRDGDSDVSPTESVCQCPKKWLMTIWWVLRYQVPDRQMLIN